MESPPRKLIVGQDRADRISALTDHLLLDIIERLDLREAVRAGALSTRWRHLPYHLSRVHLDVAHFHGDTPLEVMDAFTGAARALLTVVPIAEGEGEGEGEGESGALKVLVLRFYMSSPHLSSIGRLVEDIVSLGQTECLEFSISPPPSTNTALQLAELGQQVMPFSRAYPSAFSCLTRLTVEYHVFGDSDVTDLINACGRLRHLTLKLCKLLEHHSALKIDAPRSGIQELDFICFICTRIELICVPKLRQVHCNCWYYENPPVHFGYVPELREVYLFTFAMTWQAPFALSECLSRSIRNLSKLSLDFHEQMIWIQPEHPKNLAAVFRNLTSVRLWGIFRECDLSWTLYILEAAPVLKSMALSRHSCIKTHNDTAEKTNVVWEPSKDLKHLNLQVLLIAGCEHDEEDKMTNYIRLVMERAVGLKKIMLRGEFRCKFCNAIDLEWSKAGKASRRRIKERLKGSSSTLEIRVC